MLPRSLVALVLCGSSLAAAFSTRERLSLRNETKALFEHAFDAYMEHAHGMDELRPLTCTGRGPYDSTDGAINDVCGDYSLTLIDNLDSLVVLGNRSAFEHGVRQVIKTVSFDRDVKVSVFESTIRILGGLLSAHQFATSPSIHPPFALPWYRGELLHLASDLGLRLLPAFSTLTGIPYARINLRSGIAKGETTETNSAAAGSLILEFATLSRLTGDDRFEKAAKRAFYALWNRRSKVDLLGIAVDSSTGLWIPPHVSHVGAGLDSFIEYAAKASILLGELEYSDVFIDAYAAVLTHVRGEEGFWLRGVKMDTGERLGVTVDSLAAFFPGLQVLVGDLQNAIKSHLVYWNLWRRYSGIPETFHLLRKTAEVRSYPLRPEFIESTYHLYRATKDDLYLEIGRRVLHDLSARAKVPCGIASIKDLDTGELEDRMESFSLSETLKYLYLLFDEDNFVNSDDSNMVFTTEGHLLQLNSTHLRAPSESRRRQRVSEQLVCEPYRPTSLSSLTRAPSLGSEPVPPEVVGLRAGVKGRSDFDFARHLTGLPLESVEEAGSQALDQDCDVKKEEPYLVDVFFTSEQDQTGQAKEDLSPGPDKLVRTTKGYWLKNVSGIRAQVARRQDGTGYSIVRIGPHRVRNGQEIVITDAGLNKLYEKAGTSESSSASTVSSSKVPSVSDRPPVLLLRFGTRSSALSEVDVFAHARTGLATFGGNPLSPLPSTSTFAEDVDAPSEQAISLPRLHASRPPVPVALPPSHPLNAQGCELHPQIQTPTSEDSPGPLLLLRRGSCSFSMKVARAQAAGASGIIVWDTDGTMVQPSSTAEDSPVDGDSGTAVCLFLPGEVGGGGGTGVALERRLKRMKASWEQDEGAPRKEVVVEVVEELKEEHDEFVAGGGGGVKQTRWAQGKEVDLKRVLWIAGQPVLNARVSPTWEGD